jgi:arsenate reductase
MAVEVMGEIGVNISGQRSKSLSEFKDQTFDFVITVCGGDACPFFEGETRTRLAWSFEDPASATGTECEILGAFRGVRDEIRYSVQRFVAEYG